MLTVQQVMKKYNKTYTQVRYATETGRLKGIKIGWVWMYNPRSLPAEWPETKRKYTKRGEKPNERSKLNL
jgi:hypothetical protein